MNVAGRGKVPAQRRPPGMTHFCACLSPTFRTFARTLSAKDSSRPLPLTMLPGPERWPIRCHRPATAAGAENRRYVVRGSEAFGPSWLIRDTLQCDRRRPQCSKCAEADTTCVGRRMGATLDASTSAGHDSVEALERRVQKLQEQVDQLTGSTQAVSVDTGVSPEEGIDDAQTNPSESLDTAMHGIYYLPLSAMAGLSDERQARPNRIGFSTLVKAALGTWNAGSEIGAEEHAEVLRQSQADLTPEAFRLTYQRSEESLRRYADFCQLYCPFISEEDLIKKFDAFWVAQQTSPGSSNADDEVLVKLALATEVFLSKGHRHREPVAVGIADQAVTRLPQALQADNGYASVMCIAALAVYSDFSTLGGSIWNLVGLAVSRCLSFGLHADTSFLSRSNDGYRHRNRTVFQGLYVLDAYVFHRS